MKRTPRPKSGDVFTELTVIDLYKERINGTSIIFAACKCSCGNLKSVRLGNLTSGETRSCGCKQNEFRIKTMSNHPEPPLLPAKIKHKQQIYLECTDAWAYPGMPEWYYHQNKKNMINKTREFLTFK